MNFSKSHKNLIYQALGQGLGKGVTLIYSLLLPRILGIDSYGKFSFFYSICLVFIQPLIELGLDLILVKSIVKNNLNAVASVFFLKIVSTSLSGLVIFLLILSFNLPPLIIICLYIYTVIIAFQRTCFSYQRGQEKMKLESVIIPLEKILCVVLTVIFYLAQVNLDLVAPYSLMFSTVITAIPVIYFCRHWLREAFSQAIVTSEAWQIFREGIYLTGVSMLGLIYFRIDSIMLGVITNFDEVANYNAAFRLLEGLIYFPSVLMSVYFPKLAKSQENFSHYFSNLLKILTLMGLILSAVTFSLAGVIIPTLYGQEWSAAVIILKYLSLSIFPICIGHLVTQSLVANNFQRTYFFMVCFTTLQNILLNLLLIPRFQAEGAAIATFITELSISGLCLYWLHFKKLVKIF